MTEYYVSEQRRGKIIETDHPFQGRIKAWRSKTTINERPVKTMFHRYSDAQRVFIPYIDYDGAKVVTSMNFKVEKGNVDKRQVKRIIRKWVKKYLGRTVSSYELRLVLKTLHPIATY